LFFLGKLYLVNRKPIAHDLNVTSQQPCSHPQKEANDAELTLFEPEIAYCALNSDSVHHIHLHSLAYSRDVESKADVTGADICAAAGYNPWGLVWLFQEFQDADVKQIPQLLSDHPANGTRIQTLERHFRDNPSVFSKFNPDSKSASPLMVPTDASEQFLRPKAAGNL
jgi:hypothetical protein